jgi:hypothetical protein
VSGIGSSAMPGPEWHAIAAPDGSILVGADDETTTRK